MMTDWIMYNNSDNLLCQLILFWTPKHVLYNEVHETSEVRTHSWESEPTHTPGIAVEVEASPATLKQGCGLGLDVSLLVDGLETYRLVSCLISSRRNVGKRLDDRLGLLQRYVSVSVSQIIDRW